MRSSCAFSCFSWLLLMSRHRVSCRDITSRLLQSSSVGHDVETSLLMSRHYLLALLPRNGVFHGVMTPVQVLGTVPLLVVMSRHRSACRDIQYITVAENGCLLVSRHQFSCRDITLRCCRLHWLFLMSRLQFPCRDINLFKFCSFLSCKCCDSYRDLHQIHFDLSDVATSKLD